MSWLLTLLPTLEAVINRALALDPDAMQRFTTLQGKSIAVHVEGLEVTVYVIPTDAGLRLYDRIDEEADAVLSGGPLGLLRMGLAEDSQRILAQGAATLSGDAQVGQQFKQAWDNFTIDWEEHLSRVVGDVLAHSLMRQFRRTVEWLEYNQSISQQNLHDILTEETGLIIGRAPIEEFIGQVDELRTRVDRLQARADRLQQGLHGDSTTEAS